MVKPMPAYFLVRIPKHEQFARKEKIGSIYLPPTFVFLTRNMQCGYIVAIGEDAAHFFPDAKIDMLLLFHHFVEANDKQQMVYADKDWNYYVVTCCSHNGQNNQTYGVWTGTDIIPHQDYIFLESDNKTQDTVDVNAFHDVALKPNKNNILLFSNWKTTREDLVEQQAKLRLEIQSLAKSKMTEPIMRAISEKENELNILSKKINNKRYDLYIIKAVNPEYNLWIAECFGQWLAPGSVVYMLNIACKTVIEFNNQEYIVAKTMHFGIPYKWVIRHLKTTSIAH